MSVRETTRHRPRAGEVAPFVILGADGPGAGAPARHHRVHGPHGERLRHLPELRLVRPRRPRAGDHDHRGRVRPLGLLDVPPRRDGRRPHGQRLAGPRHPRGAGRCGPRRSRPGRPDRGLPAELDAGDARRLPRRPRDHLHPRPLEERRVRELHGRPQARQAGLPGLLDQEPRVARDLRGRGDRAAVPPLGRDIRAIGGDRRAARVAGVRSTASSSASSSSRRSERPCPARCSATASPPRARRTSASTC